MLIEDSPPSIGGCECCGQTALRRAGETQSSSSNIARASRHICDTCQQRFGLAKANLIAKAKTDSEFAKRCAQNMSRTALAEFVTACEFDSQKLIAMGTFPSLRKCERKKNTCRLVKERS